MAERDLGINFTWVPKDSTQFNYTKWEGRQINEVAADTEEIADALLRELQCILGTEVSSALSKLVIRDYRVMKWICGSASCIDSRWLSERLLE